jgi:hypothetical protein
MSLQSFYGIHKEWVNSEGLTMTSCYNIIWLLKTKGLVEMRLLAFENKDSEVVWVSFSKMLLHFKKRETDRPQLMNVLLFLNL